MKKRLLLLPILALAACDKPTSTADLTCKVDRHWERSNVLYLNNNYDYRRDDVDINVGVVTYDDYAKVTVDGITRVFEKVVERREQGEFGNIDITYKGNFPGSERTALLYIYGDITNKRILQYSISFIGQKTKNDAGMEFSMSRSCEPVKEEYKGGAWSANVPFNHHHKMPNKTESCITEIIKKVYCNSDCSGLFILNELNGKEIPLSQQDALSLSKNWDYSNMKLYQNDGKLEKHEKDACDVLNKINKFISDNDLFFDAYDAVQDAMSNCGLECQKALDTGEMGDYLIRLPETDDLRKIANKQKNAKFLSVFNPNSYAQSGYCLINVIPYGAIKNSATLNKNCNYRIYCGVPEYINYDEFYAIEVCR